MTKSNGEKVTLEGRDWLGAGALCLSLFAALGGLFLHLDRSIIEVQTCQRNTSTRLERMEADILRLEARIFRGEGDG